MTHWATWEYRLKANAAEFICNLGVYKHEPKTSFFLSIVASMKSLSRSLLIATRLAAVVLLFGTLVS